MSRLSEIDKTRILDHAESAVELFQKGLERLAWWKINGHRVTQEWQRGDGRAPAYEEARYAHKKLFSQSETCVKCIEDIIRVAARRTELSEAA